MSVKSHLEAAKAIVDVCARQVRPRGGDLDPACEHIDAALAALPGPRKLKVGDIVQQHGPSGLRYKVLAIHHCYACIALDDGAPFIKQLVDLSHADASADPLAGVRNKIQTHLDTIEIQFPSFGSHNYGKVEMGREILAILDATQGAT